ncbi:hypothetical protein [Reinekea marinisedimentorum]|uniref:Uncharacterized protein n=1 Tax=Reinekea marinisedimentorum TaxID=230495 RepID=A0A4V2UII9_9GAMM|nr:hypothetical protein [Reinekea marinisedimentorum]TCS36380.1 hypothetical protein BCF53_1252 [Reinekea marinisedimentorum]
MIRPIAFISALLLASPVFATGDIDIRADQVLTDTVQEVNFRIAVEDCTQLADISVSGLSLSLADAIRSTEGNSCEFAVLLDSSYANSPSVTATDISGEHYYHSEFFSVEFTNPTISFNGVSVTGSSQDQYLQFSGTANGDVDIPKN